MFRKAIYPGEAPQAESLAFTDPSVPSRSCCCPAHPVVKVTMPPTAGRARQADLWLCGHHYRASLGALIAAGATVEELKAAGDVSPLARGAVVPQGFRHP